MGAAPLPLAWPNRRSIDLNRLEVEGVARESPNGPGSHNSRRFAGPPIVEESLRAFLAPAQGLYYPFIPRLVELNVLPALERQAKTGSAKTGGKHPSEPLSPLLFHNLYFACPSECP